MECTKDKNLKDCSCTYISCSRRGICCECVTYHKNKNEIPGCFFSRAAEKSYDRSLDYFIHTKSKER